MKRNSTDSTPFTETTNPRRSTRKSVPRVIYEGGEETVLSAITATERELEDQEVVMKDGSDEEVIMRNEEEEEEEGQIQIPTSLPPTPNVAHASTHGGLSYYESLRRGSVERNKMFLRSMSSIDAEEEENERKFAKPTTKKAKKAYMEQQLEQKHKKKTEKAEKHQKIMEQAKERYGFRRKDSDPSVSTTVDLKKAAKRSYPRWEARNNWLSPKNPSKILVNATEQTPDAPGTASENVVRALEEKYQDLTDTTKITSENLQPLVVLNSRVLRHPLRAGRSKTNYQPFLLTHVNSTKDCWTHNGCRLEKSKGFAGGFEFDWNICKEIIHDLTLTFTTMEPAKIRDYKSFKTCKITDYDSLIKSMPYLEFLGSNIDEIASGIWTLLGSMPRSIKDSHPTILDSELLLWMLANDINPWFSRNNVSVPLPWSKYFWCPLSSHLNSQKSKESSNSQSYKLIGLSTVIGMMFFMYVCSRAFCMDSTFLLDLNSHDDEEEGEEAEEETDHEEINETLEIDDNDDKEEEEKEEHNGEEGDRGCKNQ